MRTIFYLLMITSFAIAEDDYEEIFLSTPEEIASAHAAKDTLIGGLVSPLSGQLVLQETDLIEKRGSKHTFYDFNPLHQLTSATQESTRVEFSHDPLGRILKRTLFTLTPEGWKEADTDLYLHDGKEEIGAFRLTDYQIS